VAEVAEPKVEAVLLVRVVRVAAVLEVLVALVLPVQPIVVVVRVVLEGQAEPLSAPLAVQELLLLDTQSDNFLAKTYATQIIVEHC
jgi:hypothetical protein